MYQMTGTGIKLRKNVTLALTDNRMRFQLSDLTGILTSFCQVLKLIASVNQVPTMMYGKR